MRGRRWFAATGWRHVVGLLALFFALFPVWIVLIAAFSESGTLSGQTLVPESITTKQYDTLVDEYPFWRWFFNSLIDQRRRRLRHRAARLAGRLRLLPAALPGPPPGPATRCC